MATPKKKVLRESDLGDQKISVNKLHLNLKNPRHEPVQSEEAAIEKLCSDELISELATDIAKRGALSPLEVLGVMPMAGNPGHYVSLEGNRRTCALIILADPSRAPLKYQAALRRIASKATFPRQVKVHAFADELSAKQWIDLRHLGQQGGAGTKEWTPTQQARAAGANQKTTANANKLSLDVLDRLEQRGLLTPEQRDSVSLTTLTRYLGTPGVRAIVGLGSSSELIYTHDANEVDESLQRVALDSIERLNDGTFRVNSRSSSTERLQYANKLRARGFTPTTQLPVAAPPPKPSKSQNSAAPKPRSRSANHPNTRPYLIDRSFTIKVKDKVLLRLREEALGLPLDSFAFSPNYLLRSIIERIMVIFAKKFHRLQPRMSDEDLTNACLKQLEVLKVPNSVISTIRKGAQRDSSYSLHTIGHAVHGGTTPTASELRAKFDTWEPVLKAMLAHL